MTAEPRPEHDELVGFGADSLRTFEERTESLDDAESGLLEELLVLGDTQEILDDSLADDLLMPVDELLATSGSWLDTGSTDDPLLSEDPDDPLLSTPEVAWVDEGDEDAPWILPDSPPLDRGEDSEGPHEGSHQGALAALSLPAFELASALPTALLRLSDRDGALWMSKRRDAFKTDDALIAGPRAHARIAAVRVDQVLAFVLQSGEVFASFDGAENVSEQPLLRGVTALCALSPEARIYAAIYDPWRCASTLVCVRPEGTSRVAELASGEDDDALDTMGPVTALCWMDGPRPTLIVQTREGYWAVELVGAD
ncbi:MAG: hypothetical protein Q8Q09_25125 [Deltaproteobacteria bacterium]|nr:hypothetical protein [Deltaproteobacteria bacterium]